MNHEQKDLIRRSFEKISPDAFAESFYNHLFSIQPTLRLLFPDDFGERRQDLILMLEAAIERLDEPEKLIPALEESGRRRALHGMRAGHYKPFGTALFASLRETLHANFTGETEAAWVKLYEVMSETMKRGARGLSGASAQNQNQINRRTEMKNYIRYFSASIFGMLLLVNSISAGPVVRKGSGANVAQLQGIVDQFRADLGGTNNGVGGSFTSGRREINWDDVPDSFAEPNNLSLDYFNFFSPRGVIFNAIEDATGGTLNQFAVSSSGPSGVPLRFGNINPMYPNIFQVFSGPRLFIARNTHIMEVNFSIPGTYIPATVSGFGVVFLDVDSATGGDRSIVRVYDVTGRQLSAIVADVFSGGLSFVGVSFNGGERIARVVIESGNAALSATNNDGVNGVDVVAMDDFIYGEPRAATYHMDDYDGDGVADTTVFRPSTGNWFILQSGSNIVRTDQFGTNGDIPINGDFDGDSLGDMAIYRPSNGQWWFKRSTNGTNFAATFGAPGDKPVPGDYDKDGKTDFGIYRPSNNNWFVLRSSSNFTSFYGYQFGTVGDIPVGAAVYP